MELMSTVELLGNLGEFVGAVAVVVTLFFIAIQIRHGNLLARRSEMNATLDQVTQFRMTLAGNRELAELFEKGIGNPESLDSPDSIRFDMMMSQVLWNGFQIWDRTRSGFYEIDQWRRGTKPTVCALLASEGGRSWWQANLHMFPDGFRQEIEESMLLETEKRSS